MSRQWYLFAKDFVLSHCCHHLLKVPTHLAPRKPRRASDEGAMVATPLVPLPCKPPSLAFWHSLALFWRFKEGPGAAARRGRGCTARHDAAQHDKAQHVRSGPGGVESTERDEEGGGLSDPEPAQKED